jgi:hypothetical protein
MMAKREKDRLYYEITREKPFGNFQMLLVGGASGSVLGFLIASLVGACAGMEMDALVLAFLVASFLGFFFGGIITWMILRYFGSLITDAALTGVEAAKPQESEPPPADEISETSPVLEEDASKGQSVDFVFPELSPDKQ